MCAGAITFGCLAAGSGATATRAASDSPTLVVGVSIGDVRIGAGEAGVAARYGKPSSSKLQSFGGLPVEAATYFVNAGRLEVYYDPTDMTVVGMATTSRRYKTASRVGVGSRGILADRLPGIDFDPLCSGTYRGARRGVYTSFVPAGHRRGAAITRVLMLRLAHLGDC